MPKKQEYIEKIKHYHCPRYDELPPFSLYTDQLKELLEMDLSQFEIPGEEKFITPTMISNYVKQKIIPPPVNKRYNRQHIVYHRAARSTVAGVRVVKNIRAPDVLACGIDRI